MTETCGDRPQVEPALLARLNALAARLRRNVLVEGVGVSLAFLLTAVSAQVLLDYWARGLRFSMRAALLAAVAVGVAWCVRRFLVLPLTRSVGPIEVANLLERRYPQLASVLISAVRFSRGEVGSAAANSGEFMRSVAHRATAAAEPLDFDSLLNPTRAQRFAVGIVTMLLLVAVAGLAAPGIMRIGLARNLLLKSVPWPRQTTLVVELEDGGLLAARGDDIVIEAHAEGRQPRFVEVFCTTKTGASTRESMVTVGRSGAYRYRFTRKNAQEDFTFYLRGGDDTTETYAVGLVERPRIVSSTMRITPPVYAGVEAFALGGERRAAQVLGGSRIELSVEANKPLAEAVLMAGSEKIATGSIEGTKTWVGFTAMKSHTYHFSLKDEVGLSNRRPIRFSLRVLKDDPPRIRLLLRGVGEMVTADAILPIELSFSDRYGLATVELVYQVLREGAPQTPIPLPSFQPGSTDFLSRFDWPVSGALVEAGDRLTLLARATDADDVTGPNTAQSAESILRVVTRDELLADLARKEQEYRQSFERLVDQQERVRGDLLSVRTEAGGGDVAELPRRLAPIERRQRTIASSVNLIRRQFQQIQDQLRLNGLDTTEESQRLEERIIAPLTRLASRGLPEAGDAIRSWSRQMDRETPLRADQLQVEAIRKMRATLSNMLQWEGYHEVVTMFHDILRLQRELSEESKEIVADEAADIFDK